MQRTHATVPTSVDAAGVPGVVERHGAAIGSAGIVVIGLLDYITGTEIRVTPLYFAPVAMLAWYYGRVGALVAAALSTAAWGASNALAGLEYSSPGVWVINSVTQTVSFVIVGLLLAALRMAVQREREVSLTDPLTGMLNGRAFHNAAARVVSHCRRTGRPLTIAYVDLDNFKSVNDQFGHQAGDEMLRSIAKRLLVSIRPDDVAARLGGDEFVVLFPEIGQSEAVIALSRLRASMASTLGTGPISVTTSVGGVTFLSLPTSVEEVLHAADTRMYAAKSAGKNRVIHDVVGPPVPTASGID